jgi:hypothetical protein
MPTRSKKFTESTTNQSPSRFRCKESRPSPAAGRTQIEDRSSARRNWGGTSCGKRITKPKTSPGPAAKMRLDSRSAAQRRNEQEMENLTARSSGKMKLHAEIRPARKTKQISGCSRAAEDDRAADKLETRNEHRCGQLGRTPAARPTRGKGPGAAKSEPHGRQRRELDLRQ